jgi:hypothetical protein
MGHDQIKIIDIFKRLTWVGLVALAEYVAEDGLAGHQWEERLLVL